MRSRKSQVKDPVCGMNVARDQYAIDYLGMHFAFCSLQCKERFLANPHLYIGVPGHKAPKQEGQEVIKRREFRLTEPLPEAMASRVRKQVCNMMGIRDISIHGKSVAITYDLLQATAAQIESELKRVGAELGAGWADRLQRGFVHFLEETEVDSMEIRPSVHGHRH